MNNTCLVSTLFNKLTQQTSFVVGVVYICRMSSASILILDYLNVTAEITILNGDHVSILKEFVEQFSCSLTAYRFLAILLVLC